jgi:hypothetical protein
MDVSVPVGPGEYRSVGIRASAGRPEALSSTTLNDFGRGIELVVLSRNRRKAGYRHAEKVRRGPYENMNVCQ